MHGEARVTRTFHERLALLWRSGGTRGLSLRDPRAERSASVILLERAKQFVGDILRHALCEVAHVDDPIEQLACAYHQPHPSPGRARSNRPSVAFA